MGGAERICELASANLGHDQVGQKQIDSAATVFRKEPARIVSAGCFDHFVTETAQHSDGNMTNADVIFENENCFRAAARFFAARFFVGRRRRSRNTWEINSHGRAFPFFAFDSQMSAALMGNSVTSGEAETASLLIGLGGEKWFKKMRFRFFAHSHAGVRDAD